MKRFLLHGVIREGALKNIHGHYPLINKDISVPLETKTFSHLVEAESEEEAIEEIERTLKGTYDYYLKELIEDEIIEDGSTI